jgi:3-hydroxyisobutyrate dehydrogenase-like beta-hydroxyacid dehydrogenase
MTTIGLVSPGAMGSALAMRLRQTGARVVATVEGRSQRTLRLAEQAGLDLFPTLDRVVSAADIVFSVVPPGSAKAVAADIGAAALRTGSRPLVVDLNAVSPGTVSLIDAALQAQGLELVDGSISGAPPVGGVDTRIYLSGPRAEQVGAMRIPGVDLRVVGDRVGLASAVKMSTASIYKGRIALLFHALLSAKRYGVLEPVLDDLEDAFPAIERRGGLTLALAAAKSPRYVAEMREIAMSQAAAGLSPDLFEGIGRVYASIAGSPLTAANPEDVDGEIDLEALLVVLASWMDYDSASPP